MKVEQGEEDDNDMSVRAPRVEVSARRVNRRLMNIFVVYTIAHAFYYYYMSIFLLLFFVFCILNFVFRIVDPEKQFQFDDGCLLSYDTVQYRKYCRRKRY